jgi:tetratricopeptide (TPR) repeat protein
MKGHFTSHYLAETLRDIFLQERSGLLTLESSAGPRSLLRFDRGMLVDAESPAGAPTLAAALRDEGIVSAEVLLDAVPDCTTARDLSKALIDRGAVTKEGLAAGIKGLIRRALSEAFTWQGGTYAFEDSRDLDNHFTPDVLFTFESILHGIANLGNFDPLREVLLALPGHLKMSENLFLPVHRLALKPHHGFVLSRIDGSMSMAQLAQVVPADSLDDALKFAYGLVVFGVVVCDPPLASGTFSLREIMPKHHEAQARSHKEEILVRESLARMSGKSPREILGVDEGARYDTIRSAYEGLVARFQRKNFSATVRESFKRELDLIEAKVTEAFFNLELTDLEGEQRSARGGTEHQILAEDELYRRREFSKTDAQKAQEQNVRLAEKYFVKAREYFREADYYNCIQFCRLAIKFNSESGLSYQLMADALARNPDRRWQRQAEEAYTRATELDPLNAEFFVSLGNFYRDQGMGTRARKMYEKALELLPSHIVAAKELRALRH